MCGRYNLHSPMEDVAAQFEAEARAAFAPRYNLAPTAVVPVVSLAREGRVITLHVWGLVPSWSRDPSLGARLANARAETVADKPSFRAPFKRNRCIIPADGFYEWQAGPAGPKQPYCILAVDGSILGFAGLRDEWEGPDGALATCTIITTSANALMAPIHDRMPVILARSDYAAWLDPATAPERLKALLRPCPEDRLRCYPVGRKVGDARNEGPELMEPADV
jgi:putative SOS response-associated peptidase YedK